MPRRFTRAPDDARTMTAGRLREAYGYKSSQRVSVTSVLRAILLDVIDEAAADPAAWTFEGNVRDLFHRYAEPVLARLRPDERLKTEHHQFDVIFTDLIINQRLAAYKSLNITDHLWENRRIGATRPHVLVASEKLGLVRLLRRIHETEDVSTLCLNGYPGAVTCEYTAAHITDAMAAAAITGPVRIIALVDYGPFGADLAQKLQTMLARVGLQDTTLETPFNPTLLTPGELARARYPIRDRTTSWASRVRAWSEDRRSRGEPDFGVTLEGADWHRLEALVRGWIADG